MGLWVEGLRGLGFWGLGVWGFGGFGFRVGESRVYIGFRVLTYLKGSVKKGSSKGSYKGAFGFIGCRV